VVFRNSVGLYYFTPIVGVQGGHAIWAHIIVTLHYYYCCACVNDDQTALIAVDHDVHDGNR